MRGHTNNRILAACLAAQYRNSKKTIANTQSVSPSFTEYHHGRMEAIEEVAVLLGVDDKMKAILDK